MLYRILFKVVPIYYILLIIYIKILYYLNIRKMGKYEWLVVVVSVWHIMKLPSPLTITNLIENYVGSYF